MSWMKTSYRKGCFGSIVIYLTVFLATLTIAFFENWDNATLVSLMVLVMGFLMYLAGRLQGEIDD
jgi:hypothetical protein